MDKPSPSHLLQEAILERYKAETEAIRSRTKLRMIECYAEIGSLLLAQLSMIAVLLFLR